MVTPFDDGRRARPRRRAAPRPLAAVDHGNDGLVVAGTTGESPVLTDDEQLTLFAAVGEAVTIPVVAGTGTQRHRPLGAPDRARRPSSASPAILAVCPYYNRPSQAGIEAHFRAIAAATDLPVMIYDIPVRTGRKIATDDAAAPGPRGAEHRRPQGRRRQPGRDGAARSPTRPAASRSTAATTR